nr:hypothetical protein Iba_chr03aCG6170 [Ipomoea batatas]
MIIPIFCLFSFTKSLGVTIEQSIPIAIPLGTIQATSTGTDLQVTQAACKRDKRPSALGSAPVLDALREGGEQTTSLLKKMGLETDQISHMITNLLCRAKAVENVVRKEIDPLKKSTVAKDAKEVHSPRRWKIVLLQSIVKSRPLSRKLLRPI